MSLVQVIRDKDSTHLDKQEHNAEVKEDGSGGRNALIIMGIVIAILLLVVVGVVVGTVLSEEAIAIEPTTSPTLNPTFNPTTSPTNNPTLNPTINPTVSPTLNPTVSPTANPTLNPTVSPTVNPTINPTVSPTVSPTLNPTVSPTANPTLNPTVSPTVNPTLNPTVSPTLNPTKAPTLNPTVSPTFNPTFNPTVNLTLNTNLSPTADPTRNPLQLDFTISEFFSLCGITELGAIIDIDDPPSVLDASVGQIFGFFTCIDQSLVACDIDLGRSLLEGNFCELVDPTFDCQCGQGTLNVLLDGFFDERSELGCAAVPENAQCNPAGDDLEAELLGLLQQVFFPNYVNYIEGRELKLRTDDNSDYFYFADVENELQGFQFYANTDDELIFDLVFECELGFDFSTCVDEAVLFICQDQKFIVEFCPAINVDGRCANPVGEVVPLEEGALECVDADIPLPTSL